MTSKRDIFETAGVVGYKFTWRFLHFDCSGKGFVQQ